MTELRDLYHEIIIDHGRSPRNFRILSEPTHSKEGYNPLCGDKIHLFIDEKAGVIQDLAFDGCGCAISMASASLMTETLKEKTRSEALEIFHLFISLITQGVSTDKLGKLTVLSGVSQFPARVKCATLAWHTLHALLSNDTQPVCTE